MIYNPKHKYTNSSYVRFTVLYIERSLFSHRISIPPTTTHLCLIPPSIDSQFPRFTPHLPSTITHFNMDFSHIWMGYLKYFSSNLTHLTVVDNFAFSVGYAQFVGKHDVHRETIDDVLLFKYRCSRPQVQGLLLSRFLLQHPTFPWLLRTLPRNITHLSFGSYFGIDFVHSIPAVAVLKFKGQYHGQDRRFFLTFKVSCPYPEAPGKRDQWFEEVHFVKLCDKWFQFST